MFSNISLSVIVRICLQTAHYGNDWLCGVCHTMRIDGIALKMGVCLSAASFAHLAMTAILKGMGVLGGRLFLDSFFFGGTKKNEYTRVQGIFPISIPLTPVRVMPLILVAGHRL